MFILLRKLSTDIVSKLDRVNCDIVRAIFNSGGARRAEVQSRGCLHLPCLTNFPMIDRIKATCVWIKVHQGPICSFARTAQEYQLSREIKLIIGGGDIYTRSLFLSLSPTEYRYRTIRFQRKEESERCWSLFACHWEPSVGCEFSSSVNDGIYSPIRPAYLLIWRANSMIITNWTPASTVNRGTSWWK